MSRTVLTRLIVLALGVGLAVWIARNTYWEDEPVSTPLKGEAAEDAFYSVERLLGALGMRTRRIASMQSALPPRGALLINVGWEDWLHNRPESLAPWVQSGGTLILPSHLLANNEALQAWTGISRRARAREPVKKPPAGAPARTAARFAPDSDCARMEILVDGIGAGQTMMLCLGSAMGLTSKVTPSWSLGNAYGLQVLRVNIGRGSVVVVPQSLIGNKSLLRHDHAQAFIAAAQLKRGDELLLFDLTRVETLAALLWRVAAPALVFFGMALLCLIGRELPRFGPRVAVPAPARRSLADQLRANAAFAWRTRNLAALRRAVSRALEETARRRIASYGALDIRQRVQALAAVTGADPTGLRAALTQHAATPAAQRDAIALLETTRRSLIRRPAFKRIPV
jgi:hypothetical protein